MPLYLLTQLQEEKAWPLVIDLFSSMTSADNIAIGDDFDEIVCDALSQILATLCPGKGPGKSPDDIRPLQSIIENTSIDEYVRDAALGALVVRYQQGDLELPVLTRYLQELYEFGLEQEKNQVWNAWVQACYNSQPDDFMEALRQLYEQELADAYYISLDEFSARCGMAPEKIKRVVMRQEGEFYCYLDDAVAGLRKLSCYSGEANDLLKSMENMVINQTAPKIQGASPQVGDASIPYSENSGISVGRNDPCPCGSGKKFKKCCLH